MDFKDQMNFLSRWPARKALRNGIRRIIPVSQVQRTLQMKELVTERLVLRMLDQKDFQNILAWEEITGARNSDAAAQEFLDYCFREYRERGIGPWGIQWKETGAIVGNCGFPDILFKKRCGEINYYIAPPHRGKGLALEALMALLLFGFQDLGLARIQGRCQVENVSSERVMQKAGMKLEGWIEDSPSSRDPSPKQKLYAILERDYHLSNDGN